MFEKCCQKPKQLKSNPQECAQEQITKCHGDDKGHPCACDGTDREPSGSKGTDSSCCNKR
ncbi:hypothetical protein HQ520_00890 [bacterium]|nr:hypothetical protein [bacterium]